jgi:curved DNA-binding protein
VLGGEIQLSVARSNGPPETLSIKVPPGIEDGKKLRLGGQGEPGLGGAPAGDLLLTVHVEPHPFFQRRGNNLLLRVPLTLGEAAAGATIDIPTPKGTVALHVPPGSSSGMKLRVKGHGIAPRSGSAGDLIVEVEIVLPKDLDAASRDQLVQIDRRYPQDPRAGLRW